MESCILVEQGISFVLWWVFYLPTTSCLLLFHTCLPPFGAAGANAIIPFFLSFLIHIHSCLSFTFIPANRSRRSKVNPPFCSCLTIDCNMLLFLVRISRTKLNESWFSRSPEWWVLSFEVILLVSAFFSSSLRKVISRNWNSTDKVSNRRCFKQTLSK